MHELRNTEQHRMATEAAALCKDLAVNTAVNIQGRRYVRVEAWQSIANAFGCSTSASNVQVTEDGISATGIVRRISDGVVLAEAEGFVGIDEKTWAGRPMFARRAMAQTRAISRACRSAFAFVVAMMDAGLETTPAEEMDHLTVEPVRVRPRGLVDKTVQMKPSGPASAADIDKARAAIAAAETHAELDKFCRKIAERSVSGVYDEQQVLLLDSLISERKELLESYPVET
jgi:hypothetical protein